MLYFFYGFFCIKKPFFIVELPFAATNYTIRRFRNMINALATFIGHWIIIMVGAAIACTILAFIVIALVVGIRDILGY